MTECPFLLYPSLARENSKSVSRTPTSSSQVGPLRWKRSTSSHPDTHLSPVYAGWESYDAPTEFVRSYEGQFQRVLAPGSSPSLPFSPTFPLVVEGAHWGGVTGPGGAGWGGVAGPGGVRWDGVTVLGRTVWGGVVGPGDLRRLRGAVFDWRR